MNIYFAAFNTDNITDIVDRNLPSLTDNSFLVAWRLRLFKKAYELEIKSVNELSWAGDSMENSFIIRDIIPTDKPNVLNILKKHGLEVIEKGIEQVPQYQFTYYTFKLLEESFFLLKILGIQEKTLLFK
jgi:hypothetical protein